MIKFQTLGGSLSQSRSAPIILRMSKTILEDFLTNSAKLGLLLADNFMLHALAKSWFLEVIIFSARAKSTTHCIFMGAPFLSALLSLRLKKKRKKLLRRFMTSQKPNLDLDAEEETLKYS